MLLSWSDTDVDGVPEQPVGGDAVGTSVTPHGIAIRNLGVEQGNTADSF